MKHIRKFNESEENSNKSYYTVKDLKEVIKDLPDEMKVGSSGHFGEFLECWDVRVMSVDKSRQDNTKEDILGISIESAGEEPD